MKGTILVTGFRPFAGHPANPSELVARRLSGRRVGGYQVRALVLPVVYTKIEAAIDRELARARPKAVVGLGLDYKTDAIKLERIAINLDDASIPDEAGELRQGSRISSRGPAARWSTLPLDAIASSLEAAEVPFKFSSHAGAYLCNHLMYHLCGRGFQEGIPTGFVHLPPTPEVLKPEDSTLRSGSPLGSQIKGILAVLGAVAVSISRK